MSQPYLAVKEISKALDFIVNNWRLLTVLLVVSIEKYPILITWK